MNFLLSKVLNQQILFSFVTGISLGYLFSIYRINICEPYQIDLSNKVELKINPIESLKNQYKVRNIIALVFYGRQISARILFRYLEKNLKINGGILDKILIAVRTDNKEDLNFIDAYLNQVDNKDCYMRSNFSSSSNYKTLYTILHDDDLVFKIDDDVVFISKGTFEKMFEEYLKNNHFILSANVVNHPQLSYVHARLRAILPFYEVKEFMWEKSRNESEEIDATLAMGTNYGPTSKWWENPKLAAIAHESFLHHASNGNLDIYDFNVWDFNIVEYHRWSINFIVIWGKYLNRINSTHFHIPSDEVTLTVEIPIQIKKHSIALGSAVVSHFSYWPQRAYLLRTNILEKYYNLSFDYLRI